MLATCNAYGVNPVAYLRDLLVRINSHPQAPSLGAYDELPPVDALFARERRAG